ncbi:hypothetical protein GCM10023321_49980 [Pseudonocardia eucalypti]|uniref:Flavin reductase like domain-containing protein n=1 Tax=Pseudonocardia eucalypti TaxID=648755 RepID=A0ABP9QK40_9PSEU|nr:flavin reductase (DIM6/NTAB) family NADH-FMN oxidoreductase RutF [Pseudonocardia eucalypti]
MGYDVVGIVLTDKTSTTPPSDASAGADEHENVGEKWARRPTEFSTVPADRESLRRAYSCLPSGVVALGAVIDGSPLGMVAGSPGAVSETPPFASIVVSTRSKTWTRLRELPRLGMSLLSSGQIDVLQRLAGKQDRFSGVQWAGGPGGSVFVHDAALWLECSVHEEVPAGEHLVVLLNVHASRADTNAAPMLYRCSGYPRRSAS